MKPPTNIQSTNPITPIAITTPNQGGRALLSLFGVPKWNAAAPRPHAAVITNKILVRYVFEDEKARHAPKPMTVIAPRYASICGLGFVDCEASMFLIVTQSSLGGEGGKSNVAHYVHSLRTLGSDRAKSAT